MRKKNQTFDIIACTSSILCAIHCAVIPILISFSTLTGLHFLSNSYIEGSFIMLGIVFVLISLVPSFIRVHQKLKPLIIAAIGFAFIALGRLDLNEIWEVLNTVTGAFLVAFAHYSNWKLLKNKYIH